MSEKTRKQCARTHEVRCLICGEVFIEEKNSHNCPFCGASRKYFAPSVYWKGKWWTLHSF